MSNRRNFIKGSLAAAVTLTAIGKAEPGKASTLSFPGIVYSKNNPGQWAKKVGSHAPQISRTGQTITITTKHPMSAAHYIVRHTLVLANGTVSGAKTFDPTTPEAVSTINLPAGYSGKFYATSFCNKHDLWVTEG